MADLFVVKNILRKTVFLFRFPCPVYYIKKHIREKGRCIQLRISYVGKTGCWFGFAHFNSFLTIILRISHAKWAILCRFSKKNKLKKNLFMFFISKQRENLNLKFSSCSLYAAPQQTFYVLPLNFFTFFVCGRSLGQVFFCFFIWTWDIKVFHFPPRGRISGIYRIFNTNDLIKIILYYNNGRLVWFFFNTMCELCLVWDFLIFWWYPMRVLFGIWFSKTFSHRVQCVHVFFIIYIVWDTFKTNFHVFCAFLYLFLGHFSCSCILG